MQRKIIQTLFRHTFKRISLAPRPPSACFHVLRSTLNCEPRLTREATEHQSDFSNSNPDEFGTLSPRKHTNDILSEMPEEEGDKIEFDVTNEEGRKTRKRLEVYEQMIRNLLKERKVFNFDHICEIKCSFHLLMSFNV